MSVEPLLSTALIRRADWRDESQYPSPELADASSWAWEFLRRNKDFAGSFNKFRRDFADVPATPHPDDLLINYLCEPQPSARNLTFALYKREAPYHQIHSIKDHIRIRWEINALIDPAKPYQTLIKPSTTDAARDSLEWLFARNTVDVIEPRRSLAEKAHGSAVTAICGNMEVIARLRLDGDIDAQCRDLKYKLSRFFIGGNRNGKLALMQPGYLNLETPSGIPEAVFLPDDGLEIYGEPVPELAIAISAWNRNPYRRATLHYVLRIADGLAALQAGELSNIRPDDETAFVIEMAESFRTSYPANGMSATEQEIKEWIGLANALAETDYSRLARADTVLSFSMLASVLEIAGCGAVHTRRLWQ
jgi:hypothetical protein